MKPVLNRGALLLAILVALASAAPHAAARRARQSQQPAELPAFAVRTLDDAEAQSDQLSARRQWLLVYVQPNCKPCEEVFNAFKRESEEQPDLTQKVVVLVGGATAEEAGLLAGPGPGLPRRSFYADPSREEGAPPPVVGRQAHFGARRGVLVV